MATLYELTGEYMELLAMAEDPEIDPQTIRDTMEGIGGEIEDKLEGYTVIIKELEAEREKWLAEEKRAAKNAESIGNNITNMKAAMLASMQAMGRQKVKTEHFTLSDVGNGGLKPLRLTGDVPETFQMMKVEPDMKRIREALEKGFELPFAHLEERGRHLSIR